MKNLTENTQSQQQKDIRSGVKARIIQIGISFVLQAFLLFVVSGHADWLWAWLFLGISLLAVIINGTIMLRFHPETIAERGRPKGMKQWDKVISGFWTLFQYLLVPLIAALDFKYRWTGDINTVWNFIGVAGVCIGFIIGSWAMISNTYFSTVVRIQTDRGHTVCDTGPYRFVRHPGYFGFIVQSFSTPLLLGSLTALLPAGIAAVLMVLRTVKEDTLLQTELHGYREYSQRVSKRLIPFVW